MALADPLGERARDAVFVQPFNAKRKTARVARDAPRENRVPTREKAGRYTATRRFRISSLARHAERNFHSSLVFLRFGPVAVPRGVALQISPPSLL